MSGLKQHTFYLTILEVRDLKMVYWSTMKMSVRLHSFLETLELDRKIGTCVPCSSDNYHLLSIMCCAWHCAQPDGTKRPSVHMHWGVLLYSFCFLPFLFQNCEWQQLFVNLFALSRLQVFHQLAILMSKVGLRVDIKNREYSQTYLAINLSHIFQYRFYWQ